MMVRWAGHERDDKCVPVLVGTPTVKAILRRPNIIGRLLKWIFKN
jgi:hypothetical protein